jgi:hypothetical protein
MLRKPDNSQLANSIKQHRLCNSSHKTWYQKPLQLHTLINNKKTNPSSNNINNSATSKTPAHSKFLNNKNTRKIKNYVNNQKNIDETSHQRIRYVV